MLPGLSFPLVRDMNDQNFSILEMRSANGRIDFAPVLMRKACFAGRRRRQFLMRPPARYLPSSPLSSGPNTQRSQ